MKTGTTFLTFLAFSALWACSPGERRTEVLPDGRTFAMSAGDEGGRPTMRELEAHANAMRTFLDSLGPSYQVVIRDGFVVGSNLEPEALLGVIDGTLSGCASLLHAQFMDRLPPWPVAVYLFADRASYELGVRRLTGRAPTTPYGFYRAGQRALVMNIATGTGTLAHEMVHAFVDADFPRMRAWFNEGLGSLYEASRRGKRLVGEPINWRFRGLVRAWERKGKLPTLAELVASTDRRFYADEEGLHYALARSFCVFLQEKGWLEAFYRRYRRDHLEDPTGALSLEAVLGKDLAEIDAEFLLFLGELRDSYKER